MQLFNFPRPRCFVRPSRTQHDNSVFVRTSPRLYLIGSHNVVEVTERQSYDPDYIFIGSQPASEIIVLLPGVIFIDSHFYVVTIIIFFNYCSILRTLIKASLGTSTLPIFRIFFFPSFCFSRSLRLRVISPP